jgi:hypothetical protein
MDQISKKGPFSAAKLAALPKHKAFGVKEAAGAFTPGKRAAGGASAGPLTRRLQALKKSHTVSAFGVDHGSEVSKWNPGALGAAAGKATKKFGQNMSTSARGKQIKGMNVTVGQGRLKGQSSTSMGPGGRLTRMQSAVGGIGQKAGEAMVNNPLKTTAAITAGGAGTAGAGAYAYKKKG